MSDKDIKTDYLQELMRINIPTLSLDEERDLGLRIAKGDTKALAEELADKYLENT